jgi:2-hydroxy-6-oxonona-2,4-dienedioate hydrolase
VTSLTSDGPPLDPEGAIAPLRTTLTQVGPWRMHALLGGSGERRPPLVLVHGYGVSCRYWSPLGGRLARHYPVAAPDLPGHGRSSTPASALDVPALCDALTRWMTALDLGPAVLLGNSLGCQIAAELAVREPGRVRALVFFGPTVDPLARSGAGQALRVFLSAPVEDPRLAPVIAGDYLRMGVGRLRQELRHMLRHRLETLLPEIAAPVLVLRGSWDRVAPRRWAERVTTLLPRSTLHEIGAGGHAIHFSRPRSVLRVLLPWLEEHVPPVG